MKSIETRLKKLEAENLAPVESLKVIYLEEGESEADALARSGIDPKSQYLAVQFVSAIDENL